MWLLIPYENSSAQRTVRLTLAGEYGFCVSTNDISLTFVLMVHLTSLFGLALAIIVKPLQKTNPTTIF